jgi:hypothetical protein
LRKYTGGVKKLRERFLSVTLMWWNDVCKQRALAHVPASVTPDIVNFLTTSNTRNDQQAWARRLAGIAGKGPRNTAGFTIPIELTG